MSTKLGRIHRTHRGNALLIHARRGDIHLIRQFVCPLPHLVHREGGGGILRFLIIADSVRPTITRKDICRFQASGTLILHLHEVHIAVGLDDETDIQFIAHLQRFAFCQRLAVLEQDATHLQGISLRRHLVHLFLELGIDSSPSDACRCLHDGHLADVRHLARHLLLYVTQAFAFAKFNFVFANPDFAFACVRQPIGARGEEGIDGIGCGYRRIPYLCLLLLEEPSFQFFLRLLFVSHEVYGLDSHYLGRYLVTEPRVEGFRGIEIAAHRLGHHRILHQRLQEFLGPCRLPGCLQDNGTQGLAINGEMSRKGFQLARQILVDIRRYRQILVQGRYVKVLQGTFGRGHIFYPLAFGFLHPLHLIGHFAAQETESLAVHRLHLVGQAARHPMQAGEQLGDGGRHIGASRHSFVPAPRAVRCL